mgnify:CR=1 FL=1
MGKARDKVKARKAKGLCEKVVHFAYFCVCSLLQKPTAPKTAHTTRRQWIKKAAKKTPRPPPTLPLFEEDVLS